MAVRRKPNERIATPFLRVKDLCEGFCPKAAQREIRYVVHTQVIMKWIYAKGGRMVFMEIVA